LKTPRSRFPLHRYLQFLLVVIALACCLFAVQAAARFGSSRLLMTYSLTAGNLTAAREAIQLTPKDAEAHFAEAALLSSSTLPGASDQAISELERAVSLRPSDYALWSQLGLLRDQMGNTAGALIAFDEAISRAPSYSQPRWNRGNVLLRSGRYEAAFDDLSQAAQSNPDLVPSLIDLAWGVSRGDAQLTEQLAQINTDRRRLAFAKLLARRGKAQEAVLQLGKVGNVPEVVRRELVEQLLAKSFFREAYNVWKTADAVEARKEPAAPFIHDGGFEGRLSLGETGFGWRVPRDLQATVVSLDSGKPQSGLKDLSIEFGGDSNPGLALVSQLVLVEPSKRYKINFSARSQQLVTGGLPLVIAADASGDMKRLGQSTSLAKGTTDWQPYSFELTAAPQTAAIVLTLTRDCTTSPCPIFGSISLDSFSVERLN
jgi:tetratricopeptide (TPR) repeat protein